VERETVLQEFPTLRQSLLAVFDECELSALFKLRYENGWTTSPAARGRVFHWFAAECLRTMREQDVEEIPVEVAEAILEECLLQRGIPPADRVRVPLRELPLLEMSARKFARDNAFSVRRIIDVERRLEARLSVPDWKSGELYERVLSGQIDALISHPNVDGRHPDEAIILDWKNTWKLPPERDDQEETPATEPGFFQLMFYAWLVFRNYPAVEAVNLREFYVARTRAKTARITRARIDEIERRLRYVVVSFDRAVGSGAPRNLKLPTLERHGSWFPQPGIHCFFCASRARCPVDGMARGDADIKTQHDAEHWAAVRTWAKALQKRVDDRMLKPWAELHGPIPIRSSAGRRVLGYRGIARDVRGNPRKTRWEDYDAGEDEANPPRNEALEEAMRRSLAETRALRGEHHLR
jgi:hypothetical protein